MIDRLRDELNARIEDDRPAVKLEVINVEDETFYIFQQEGEPEKAIVAEPRAIVEVEP